MVLNLWSLITFSNSVILFWWVLNPNSTGYKCIILSCQVPKTFLNILSWTYFLNIFPNNWNKSVFSINKYNKNSIESNKLFYFHNLNNFQLSHSKNHILFCWATQWWIKKYFGFISINPKYVDVSFCSVKQQNGYIGAWAKYHDTFCKPDCHQQVAAVLHIRIGSKLSSVLLEICLFVSMICYNTVYNVQWSMDFHFLTPILADIRICVLLDQPNL